MVDGLWSRRWFTNAGPLTREFERALRDYLGVAHCVVTSSGTLALSVLTKALGLTGEVIIPSFTFISTAHTLVWNGLKPVFCDVDAKTWNLCPDHCSTLLTSKTSAIIATHLWGHACDIERLEEIARKSGIHLLFDAAHAIGCTHSRSLIGGFGGAEVFSFHATKSLHTCEGGAITTNDGVLAESLRRMRAFGVGGLGSFGSPGTNAKMSELHAAMGLTNLEVLDKNIRQSRLRFETYDRQLRHLSGFSLFRPRDGETSNYGYVVARISAQQFGLPASTIAKLLQAENILARRYFYPGAHNSEPHRSLDPGCGALLPNTKLACEQVLVLPGGAGIGIEDVAVVCDLLQFVAVNAERIGSRIGFP